MRKSSVHVGISTILDLICFRGASNKQIIKIHSGFPEWWNDQTIFIQFPSISCGSYHASNTLTLFAKFGTDLNL